MTAGASGPWAGGSAAAVAGRGASSGSGSGTAAGWGGTGRGVGASAVGVAVAVAIAIAVTVAVAGTGAGGGAAAGAGAGSGTGKAATPAAEGRTPGSAAGWSGGEGSIGNTLAWTLTGIARDVGDGAADRVADGTAGLGQPDSTARCKARAAPEAQAMPRQGSAVRPARPSAPAPAVSGPLPERWSVSNDNTRTLPFGGRPASREGTRPDLHLSIPGS